MRRTSRVRRTPSTPYLGVPRPGTVERLLANRRATRIQAILRGYRARRIARQRRIERRTLELMRQRRSSRISQLPRGVVGLIDSYL